MDLEQLYQDLERDEGVRLKPYADITGKLTIGVGRNLTDNGISAVEAHRLLANDVAAAFDDLDRNAPWWRSLSADRQRGFVNMCFNLGWPRLSKFTKMLAALERGDGQNAAIEVLDSTWAKQVGERANRIARLFAI